VHGGEAGDVLNHAVDPPEVRANLYEVRMAEPRTERGRSSVTTQGHLLGYHDSGMPTPRRMPAPTNLPTHRSRGGERFVAVVRDERPQVIHHRRRRSLVLPHPDPHPSARDQRPGVRGRGDPAAVPRAARPGSRPRSTTGILADSGGGTQAAFANGVRRAPTSGGFARDFPEGARNRSTTWSMSAPGSTVVAEARLAHRTQVDPGAHWMRRPTT